TDADIEDLRQNEWNTLMANADLPKENLRHVFVQLKYRILLEKTQRQRRLLIRASQIAAVLLLPLALFFFFKNNNLAPDADKQLSLIEWHCPEGTRAKFTLPDGSSGWLAGGSVMAYAADFEKNREVSVEGEAFFSVKRDEEHPFTVKLNDFNVRVLGTQFNVLHDADEPVSEVVVLSGLVEVAGNAKKFTEQLSADKMLQHHKEKNEIRLSDVDAKSYTAWTEGRLEFNNEHLESVRRKIERFYDVDVELHIEGLEDNLFRANVKIGSVEELMNYMALALPVKYELMDAKKSTDGKVARRRVILSKK
ncbi:MAG: FecR domain-containing protein, partial [Mangrovibacterium sp.]|nr:FecR domain-containing protein [Mangrovibacterium sp.]